MDRSKCIQWYAVDEDAPTNATGAAVSTDVPIVRKKKKKTFLDARTKAYKEHQKKLEASRQRREERKKNASKMNEGQLDEREKGIDQLPRQFLNPSKEVMILKKGKVIVIDKKDQEKYMRQGWELAEALSPQDKKVIDAFYFTDKPMTGKILKTDGKTLEKTGMGAQTIAKVIPQSGGEFKVVAKMDGRSTQEIVNYIKKTFPKQLVKYEGTQKTFSQKVQEQIGEFGRESFLAENNMEVIKSIVKSKGAKDLKMKDGKLKMDAFTASAITQVYDKVNPTNKKKMEALANGKKSDLMKLQALAMKFVK